MYANTYPYVYLRVFSYNAYNEPIEVGYSKTNFGKINDYLRFNGRIFMYYRSIKSGFVRLKMRYIEEEKTDEEEYISFGGLPSFVSYLT